jgi:Fuc2NAc and GlcNAc transferase
MDVPNARSSHAIPTPRGGGIAIVAGAAGALVALFISGKIDTHLFLALTGGGLAVAGVGFIDDRRPLSARVRLAVHIAAAVWALVWLGGAPALHIPGPIVLARAVSYVLSGLGIVWVLNLYNFMDGIDGLAASEAVFVALGSAFLLLLAGGSPGVVAASAAFGAACLGFLGWNWPPAKIFMGDVGSGYIGYTIAVLALAAARDQSSLLAVWLILSGLFIIDATVTLVRRLFRGEKVYSAHRSHAYQWLARRWKSHKSVTVLAVGINLLWLLPWSWAAATNPTRVIWIMAVAYVPLTILVLAAGAGRAEAV